MCTYLVGWESQNYKSLVGVLVVQCLQALVLRGEPTADCYHHLISTVEQVDLPLRCNVND